MSPELRTTLDHWLRSGNDTERRHAARLLAMGDEPTDDSQPPPATVPLAQSLRAARLGYRSCLYGSHEGCGCAGTHCHRLSRVVSLRDCIACLEPPP